MAGRSAAIQNSSHRAQSGMDQDASSNTGGSLFTTMMSFSACAMRVGPTVGVDFDPSHLMWMRRRCIGNQAPRRRMHLPMHGKDTYIEARARIDESDR